MQQYNFTNKELIEYLSYIFKLEVIETFNIIKYDDCMSLGFTFKNKYSIFNMSRQMVYYKDLVIFIRNNKINNIITDL